jgi:hypothetical protein
VNQHTRTVQSQSQTAINPVAQKMKNRLMVNHIMVVLLITSAE